MFNEIVSPIAENRRHIFDVIPIPPGTNTEIDAGSNALIIGQDLVVNVAGQGPTSRVYASGALVANVTGAAQVEARDQAAYIIQLYGVRDECSVHTFDAFAPGTGHALNLSASSLGAVRYYFAPVRKASQPPRTVGNIWTADSAAVLLPLINSMEVTADDDDIRRTLGVGKAYLIDPGSRFKIFSPTDRTQGDASFLIYSPTYLSAGG